MRSRSLGLAALLWGLAACGGSGNTTPRAAADSLPPRDEPPVALDPDPPVTYPPELYAQGVEGTVELRLFVTELGTLVPESTQVTGPSGYPAFDAAAVTGVARMRFAPAQRDGQAVAAAFTQPVHFRRSPRPGTTP